jgi:hypothetical protein
MVVQHPVHQRRDAHGGDQRVPPYPGHGVTGRTPRRPDAVPMMMSPSGVLSPMQETKARALILQQQMSPPFGMNAQHLSALQAFTLHQHHQGTHAIGSGQQQQHQSQHQHQHQQHQQQQQPHAIGSLTNAPGGSFLHQLQQQHAAGLNDSDEVTVLMGFPMAPSQQFGLEGGYREWGLMDLNTSIGNDLLDHSTGSINPDAIDTSECDKFYDFEEPE